MTQQNNDFKEEYNRLIQEAKGQIEQQQYQEAIDNLDYIIQNNEGDGYAFFLRGKSYAQLKKYKSALTNYETALNIYRETDDKKYQIYTLIELTFVYPFNGKVKEGFLAQQETFKIAKELDLPEDDPLYSYISHAAQMSDDGLNKMQSALQNVNSIPPWDKFGFMGRLMGYATRGKWQFYLFFIVWLILAIPALILAILSAPVWLPKMVYQMRRRRSGQ